MKKYKNTNRVSILKILNAERLLMQIAANKEVIYEIL